MGAVAIPVAIGCGTFAFRFRLKPPVRQHGRSGLGLKVPPVAVAVIAAVLMWLAASATPAFDFLFPARTVTAASFAVIGATTAIAGVVSFRRAKTTVNPMKPGSTSSLVTSGIYRYTRNPMYLGLLLVLIGWAAFLSNLLAPVVLPAFVLYMNRFQIGPEESALATLFADHFSQYRTRVRRWL